MKRKRKAYSNKIVSVIGLKKFNYLVNEGSFEEAHEIWKTWSDEQQKVAANRIHKDTKSFKVTPISRTLLAPTKLFSAILQATSIDTLRRTFNLRTKFSSRILFDYLITQAKIRESAARKKFSGKGYSSQHFLALGANVLLLGDAIVSYKLQDEVQEAAKKSCKVLFDYIGIEECNSEKFSSLLPIMEFFLKVNAIDANVIFSFMNMHRRTKDKSEVHFQAITLIARYRPDLLEALKKRNSLDNVKCNLQACWHHEIFTSLEMNQLKQISSDELAALALTELASKKTGSLKVLTFQLQDKQIINPEMQMAIFQLLELIVAKNIFNEHIAAFIHLSILKGFNPTAPVFAGEANLARFIIQQHFNRMGAETAKLFRLVPYMALLQAESEPTKKNNLLSQAIIAFAYRMEISAIRRGSVWVDYYKNLILKIIFLTPEIFINDQAFVGLTPIWSMLAYASKIFDMHSADLYAYIQPLGILLQNAQDIRQNYQVQSFQALKLPLDFPQVLKKLIAEYLFDEIDKVLRLTKMPQQPDEAAAFLLQQTEMQAAETLTFLYSKNLLNIQQLETFYEQGHLTKIELANIMPVAQHFTDKIKEPGTFVLSQEEINMALEILPEINKLSWLYYDRLIPLLPSGTTHTSSSVAEKNKIISDFFNSPLVLLLKNTSIDMALFNLNPFPDELPIKTKGGGDCAFHAVLGEFDVVKARFSCPNVQEKRTEVGEQIKAAFLSASPTPKQQRLKDLCFNSIKDLIIAGELSIGPATKALQNAVEQFATGYTPKAHVAWCKFYNSVKKDEEIVEYINLHGAGTSLKLKFYSALNKNQGALRRMIDARFATEFADFNRLSDDFAWGEHISNEVVEEYAKFIASPTHWLLPHELDIIARVFDVTIHFYAAQTAAQHIYNPDQTHVVSVQFDASKRHFERRLAYTNWRSLIGIPAQGRVLLIFIDTKPLQAVCFQNGLPVQVAGKTVLVVEDKRTRILILNVMQKVTTESPPVEKVNTVFPLFSSNSGHDSYFKRIKKGLATIISQHETQNEKLSACLLTSQQLNALQHSADSTSDKPSRRSQHFTKNIRATFFATPKQSSEPLRRSKRQKKAPVSYSEEKAFRQTFELLPFQLLNRRASSVSKSTAAPLTTKEESTIHEGLPRR